MGKRNHKNIYKLLSNQIVLICLCIVLYFSLVLILDKPSIHSIRDILQLLLYEVLKGIRSVMPFAAILTIFILPKVKKRIQKYFEDIKKVESNKHRLLKKYIEVDEIKSENIINTINKNEYDENGILMKFDELNIDDKKKIVNKIKSKYADDDEYAKEEASIECFKINKHVNLAERRIYTNITGQGRLAISSDTGRYHPLDSFIEENRSKLLSAHHNKKNNSTIRLDNYKYDKNKNCLKFDLSRTTYFDMLITNRALDYPLGETTLRNNYEYNKKMTHIKDSKLSNQIGITGVVITNDGYILTEVRGFNKSIWKNMFGPPISFPLKENDVCEQGEKIKGNKYILEDKIIERIKKSLFDNFNFIENKDYDKLVFKKNFMGFSRDILEGGKPNLYFFVQLKENAIKMTKKMQEYASYDKEKNDRKVLTDSKIKNNYYFVKHDKFKVDYFYRLLCDSDTIKIGRKYKPRCTKHAEENTDKIFVVSEDCREVAEGMLASVSFLNLILKYGNNKIKTNRNRIVGKNW